MLLATLIFFGLAQATTVFLNPPEALPSHISPQQANLVLAAHLGLEQFEVVNQPGRLNHLFREREFVGQGDQSALLLLVDEAYARGKLHERSSADFALLGLQTSSHRLSNPRSRSPSLSLIHGRCF